MPAMYMQLPFAEGSVTATGYVGWVRLTNITFNVETDVSMEGGDVTNRDEGETTWSKFTIEKLMEDSSGNFLQEAAQGTTGHDVVIAICTSGDDPREYARYDLTDAKVCSYELTGSDEAAAERITIAYASITAKYTPHDPRNAKKSPVVVMQDITDGG